MKQIADVAVGRDYETTFSVNIYIYFFFISIFQKLQDKSQVTSLSLPSADKKPSTTSASTSTSPQYLISTSTSPVVSLCEDLKKDEKLKQMRSMSTSPFPSNSMHEEETQTSL